MPFLKDIPDRWASLPGPLQNKRKTTLYVFLTPRIMRPNFEGPALMQKGPQAAAGITEDARNSSPRTSMRSMRPIEARDEEGPAGAQQGRLDGERRPPGSAGSTPEGGARRPG